jgi:cobaltochelatase CobT
MAPGSSAVPPRPPKKPSGFRFEPSGETLSETFQRVTTATLKAVAGRKKLGVSYGFEAPGVAGEGVRLPLPSFRLRAEEVAMIRGEADSLALKLRHHDSLRHAAWAPEGDKAKEVFDALEEARLEALGVRTMAGVAANVAAALAQRCKAKGLDRVAEIEEEPIAEMVRLLAREALTGEPVPAVVGPLVSRWRQGVESRARTSLARLKACIEDQDAFAQGARRVIADLALEDEPAGEQTQEQEQENKSPEEENKDESSPGEAMSEVNPLSSADGEEDEASAFEEGEEGEGEAAALLLPGEGEGGEARPGPDRSTDGVEGGGEDPYRVFSTEFDEVVEANRLCDSEELTRLRGQLDQRLLHLQGAIGKLANRLQRQLLAKQLRSWEFNLEEGLLDTSRLARIVVNSSFPLSYKQEKETEFRDTVVSLLIDNSGSMRGRPITIAAICADILARTLERCGIGVEVLGFTTRAWKGGQSREKWLAAGKPREPGRLNDLRHIVYKAADMPWRRTRRNLGLMLREGLLKENIDGEALLWAHKRLIARPEERRILIVISDGAPVDDSTLSANRGNYLDRHLRTAIEWIEQCSSVELVAIGIGHDVTRYYRRAVTLIDAEQLGGTMIGKLAELFDEPLRPRSRPTRARRRSPVWMH